MSLVEIAPEIMTKIAGAAGSGIRMRESAIKSMEEDIVLPLIRAPDVEKFLEENLDAISDAERELFVNAVKGREALSERAGQRNEGLRFLFKSIKSGAVGGSFSSDLRKRFVAVLELEHSNASYMLRLTAGKAFAGFISDLPRVQGLLKEAEIDASDMLKVEVKLGALVLAVLHMLAVDEPGLEGKLSEMVSIAERYSEEMDDFITVLQMINDRKPEEEIERA